MLPQGTVFIIQTHPSKGVRKNMQKAWDFAKYRLCHRYYDNSLQKTFRTIILQNETGPILLIVVNLGKSRKTKKNWLPMTSPNINFQ